ncbi:hypothetical protein BJX68DRAFT_267337 [Aspergillus pseudodeflectus]|uniref:Uncharacterized protein n=1 Tax=Aspergillus pseudodeflectus TaxID=176178 RepID=A0ABR4K9M5_9EURO
MTLVQKYVKLVDAKFLDHIGRNGASGPVPQGFRDGTTKELSKKQSDRLATAIQDEIKKLESWSDEELLKYVNTGDTRERMKLILDAGEILEIASMKIFAERMSQVCDIPSGHSGSEGKDQVDPNDDSGHQSERIDDTSKGTPGETDEKAPNHDLGHQPGGDDDTPMDTSSVKTESDDDLHEDYGPAYENESRGRERSASPMREEDKKTLQKILKTHCEKAIESLKRCLSGDQSSVESLKAMNIQIRDEVTKSLGWEPQFAQNFGIPYEKFREGVDPLVVQPLKTPCSEEDEKVFSEKLGQAKVHLYHVCLQNHIQIEWLNGVLEGSGDDQEYPQRYMYDDNNTDATTYWPYSILRTPEFVILYEKKKRVSDDRTKSSYGVQVYDAEKKVFQIQVKANIGNDNLQKWRLLPNAYKFYAADRQCKTSELGHIEHIYFFTATQPRSGRHDSKTPAPTDVCVKFQKSILPRMLQRSKVDAFLPEGESVDDIIEQLASRDQVKLPWKVRARKVVYDLTGDKVKHRPMTTLEEELFKKNPRLKDRAEKPLSQSGTVASDKAVSDLREEVENKLNEFNVRLSTIEEKVVTTEYLNSALDKKFTEFLDQIKAKAG